MATFVLVHGSWAGGWAWWKVAPLLRAAGHQVHTPTLTGLGERSHLLTRDTGLHLHIEDIVQVLRFEGLHDVVLVGHSYGGMVITGVAEAIPQRLRRLVYVDAFVPRHGQSAFDLWPELADRLRARLEDGWLIPPASAEVFGITDPAYRAWFDERGVPMPLLTCEQPLRVPDGQAERLPRSFIVAADNPVTPGKFAALARQAGGHDADYHEVAGMHEFIVTHADEVAGLLSACAER